ncbi:MAG TPA: hypothetical protein VH765_07080 [Xanthobacteraceae bacterium]|jgi:hypothetical protein
MSHRFWVIGGEYTSTLFEELVGGTERLFGPFTVRKDAEHTWREVSERHRSQCNVRFSIVEERALVAAR